MQELAHDSFGGAAEKQAQTFTGQLSMLRDALTNMATDVGNIYLPAVTGIVNVMAQVVTGLDQALVAVKNWLAEWGIGAPQLEDLCDRLGFTNQRLKDQADEANNTARALKNYAAAAKLAASGGNTPESAMQGLRSLGLENITEAKKKYQELKDQYKANALGGGDPSKVNEQAARAMLPELRTLGTLIREAGSLQDTLDADAESADKLDSALSFEKALTGVDSAKSRHRRPQSADQRHAGAPRRAGRGHGRSGMETYMNQHGTENSSEVQDLKKLAKLRQERREAEEVDDPGCEGGRPGSHPCHRRQDGGQGSRGHAAAAKEGAVLRTRDGVGAGLW